MNADMIGVTSTEALALAVVYREKKIVRKISHRKESVLVENVAFNEPLQKLPRH